MTSTETLIQELVNLGCPAARAFTLVSEARTQWAAEPKQRSRHSLAQSKYYFKRKAKRSSDDHPMISDDHHDHSKESLHTSKENIGYTYSVNSLRSLTAPEDGCDLFKKGLPLLSQLTGNKSHSSLRSLLGRWVKMVDGDHVHVLAAIEDAAREQPIDPRGWIFGRLNQIVRERNKNRPESYQKKESNHAVLAAVGAKIRALYPEDQPQDGPPLANAAFRLIP